jgi:hypothetical protein
VQNLFHWPGRLVRRMPDRLTVVSTADYACFRHLARGCPPWMHGVEGVEFVQGAMFLMRDALLAPETQ